jgi:putative transposase
MAGLFSLHLLGLHDMSRLPRLAIAGQPHLVVQRGVASQPVFVDDEDRRAFLARLGEAAAATAHRVSVHAYALLDTEIHLVVTPADAAALSRMMQSLGRTYVAGFNRRHQRSGTLWQGRFRATVLEPERYLVAAMQYVETRPASAGFVDAIDYPWSSVAHHVGRQASSLITDHPVFWRLGNTPFDREAAYRRLIEHPLPEREASQLQMAVDKGWALGTDQFLHDMELVTRRRLRPLARGRPAKTKTRRTHISKDELM